MIGRQFFVERKKVKKSLASLLTLFVVFALQTKAQDKLPLKLIATILLPDLVGDLEFFAPDLKGDRLFLCAENSKTVEVLNLHTGKRIHTIKGFGEPHDIVYLPDSNKLIVTDGGDDFGWVELDAQYCDLAGVSAEVEVSTDHSSFREKMLITHRGLSGPAILQISTYWREHSSIRIDLAPGLDATLAIREAKERNMASARSALQAILPKRFATRWLDLHALPAWTNRALEELERQVHEWVVEPAGTEGYEKAEVTVGGVDTEELSSKTMESRRVPGLFFIGEVVDVTGHLGGFNFQWAWASGAAAGRAL